MMAKGDYLYVDPDAELKALRADNERLRADKQALTEALHWWQSQENVRLHGEIKRLRAELEEANQMLRSAHSVAERKGLQTNWEAFERQLADLLKRQHDLRRALEGK